LGAECPAIHLLLAEAHYHMLQWKVQATLRRLIGNSLFRENALISQKIACTLKHRRHWKVI